VGWHEAARLSRKQTTFDDFQMCARFLIEQGWTEAGRIAAIGASAGGLLIGVAANEAPNLYGAMVAQVPFVDAVVTMADPTMPLVANEWDEWGNPNEPLAFEYLSRYSPIDQVKPQPYPPMLLQAGLWDHRVCYWEVAKFAQRLREKSTSSSPILFQCDMGEGHGSGKVCITHKSKRTYSSLLLLLLPSSCLLCLQSCALFAVLRAPALAFTHEHFSAHPI
jgi:oligopeptidase B